MSFPGRHWKRRTWLSWLLWPLSILFGAVAARRRARLQACASPATVPVWVVGNIHVGGVGKTPLLSWLVSQLLERGFRPGIVSRGYGGKRHATSVRVQGDDVAADCGDEPLMLARRWPEVPVVVDVDRQRAVEYLVDHHAVDVVLSDDGLQHYAMARALEWVILPPAAHAGNGFLLPAGPLREPMSRLAQVDTVVRRCENRVTLEHEQIQPAFALELGAPARLQTGQSTTWSALRGRACCAVAGIGRPEGFFLQLQGLGLQVEGIGYPDHHEFTAADIDKVANGRPVLVTEKDAVKLAALALASEVWVVPANVIVNAPLQAEFSKALNKLATPAGRRADADREKSR